MKRFFPSLVIATAALFATVPFLIANAPIESTMGLIQKIFYFHVPSWMAMYTAIAVCGVGSALYLFRGNRAAELYAVAGGEVAVLFGLMGLVSGPLWGRKAWGVWWVWEPRLTSALLMELIFIASLLARIGEARRRHRVVRHGDRAVRLQVGRHLARSAPEDDGGAAPAEGLDGGL